MSAYKVPRVADALEWVEVVGIMHGSAQSNCDASEPGMRNRGVASTDGGRVAKSDTEKFADVPSLRVGFLLLTACACHADPAWRTSSVVRVGVGTLGP